MTGDKNIDGLIPTRWPELKKRAQSEQDLEKLMTLLVEIDELLFNVEMRVRVKDDTGFNARAESQSVAQVSRNQGANE
jgi:acetoacetate decarboxylase